MIKTEYRLSRRTFSYGNLSVKQNRHSLHRLPFIVLIPSSNQRYCHVSVDSANQGWLFGFRPFIHVRSE